MVTAIIIIEMMGRPPEHLKENLEGYVGKLDDVNGVNIINKSFSDPKELEERKDLYTAFAEVEIECDSFKILGDILFDFMPASVEVVEPSKVAFSCDEATDFMNALVGRLHRYDDVVKAIQNKGAEVMKQLGVAKKLLLENDIIDNEGKILKIPEGMGPDKKADKVGKDDGKDKRVDDKKKGEKKEVKEKKKSSKKKKNNK
jgi:hypothetical protein